MNAPLVDYGRNGRRIEAFPVIDTHAHIYASGNLEAPSIEQRLRVMDRTGITMAFLSSSLAISGDFKQGNDEVASVIRRYPGRFAGYCHVSANYPDVAHEELPRCFDTGLFRGIKVYQTGIPFDDSRYDAVWDFANKQHAPILAHTWGGNLTGFDTAAARNPHIPFLAAHAGSGFAYQPYIDAALKTPNLYLDLTYSREHTNMIETMVRAVGADRVVWGSDEPLFSMAHQLGKVLFADLPDADKRLILGGNTIRLFKLPPGSIK